MQPGEEQELHPEVDYATSLIQAIDLTGSKKALRRRFEPSCLIALVTVALVMIITSIVFATLMH